LETITLGVCGIVIKDTAPETLLDCIDRVVLGERRLASDFIQAALTSEKQRLQTGPVSVELTMRVTKIIQLVATELSNKHISPAVRIV
jgi:DNA-binding NarL/FixJ family response regulator